MFLLDFLFFLIFFISSFVFFKDFLKTPFIKRYKLERKGLSIIQKENKTYYKIFVSSKEDSNYLLPMEPELSYIDYLKLKNKKHIHIYIKNNKVYYDQMRKNIFIGFSFLFISIGLLILSIYEFFLINQS